MSDFDWNKSAVRKLKTLWDRGLSCREIAIEMGGGLTRNAIIGKVTRLNLAKRRVSTHYLVADPKKPRDARTKLIGPVVEREAPAPKYFAPQPFLGISLFDLEPHHCRYPRGGDDGMPILFCGQPKRDDSSYCPVCHALCTGGKPRELSAEERMLRSASARRAFNRKSKAA